MSALASVALDIKAARERDQAQFERSLAQLLRNDANILQVMDVRHNESLEAVRQLTVSINTRFRSFQVKEMTTYEANCRE